MKLDTGSPAAAGSGEPAAGSGLPGEGAKLTELKQRLCDELCAMPDPFKRTLTNLYIKGTCRLSGAGNQLVDRPVDELCNRTLQQLLERYDGPGSAVVPALPVPRRALAPRASGARALRARR